MNVAPGVWDGWCCSVLLGWVNIGERDVIKEEQLWDCCGSQNCSAPCCLFWAVIFREFTLQWRCTFFKLFTFPGHKAISMKLHIPGQRSQYMICKPHLIGFQCSTFKSVPARLSLPGCSMHIIAILGELWLTTPTLHYATCSITVHLPLLSSGCYVSVLGHYTITIALIVAW